MDYGKAKDIRKQGLSSLITENLVGGKGIGSSFTSAISDRTKATFTGIKESFDPLNIAKKMTGGSKLAPALLGRMMGRKQEDIEHFSGKPKKSKGLFGGLFGGKSNDNQAMAESLGSIYKELQRASEEKKLDKQEQKNKVEGQEAEEERRNSEIIKAIIGTRIKATKSNKDKIKEIKQTEKEKPFRDEKGRFAKKPTEKEFGKEPTTPSGPTGPTGPTVPTTKAPAPSVPTPSAPPSRAPTAPAPSAPTAPPSKPSIPTATPQAPTPIIPRPPVSVGKGIAGVVSAGAGTIATITAALVAAGVTNAYAQKAILANVGKESGYKPRDENLAAYANTSNDRIREVFTKRALKYTNEELNQIKKDPYKFGEMVYGKDTDMGKSMGNLQEGDGFKYRGRGSIQLTGKNNYSAYSKAAGVDLIANPELANQPDIDAKIVAAFVKKGVGSKLNDFTDQQTANRAVTQAIGGSKLNLDVGVGAKILAKVDEYSGALSGVPVSSPTTGNQIDSSSKQNKDLKQTTNDQPAPSVVNNLNVDTKTSSSSKEKLKEEDDRPAFLKKAKG